MTTLERSEFGELSIMEYYGILSQVRPEIETFTGRSWAFPEREEGESIFCGFEAQAFGDNLMSVPIPAFEFLVFLRHNGFPSPLLDWSRSPYVAAYFAFADPPEADFVSVLGFVKTTSGWHSVPGDPRSTIRVMPTIVGGQKRHYSQKAVYTMALGCDDKKDVYFSNHMLAIERQSRPTSEDVLFKINIPSRDRSLALESIDEFNINHFTLFQSEDSLIKALALRYSVLENF